MSASNDTAAQRGSLTFKRVLPIFAIIFVDLMGLTIIIPLLPLYAASFGAGAFVIGMLEAAYPLMQFIGAPLLGGLSDRHGRKPVLLFSQFGTLTGFILLGLAGTLPLLFVARFIDGLSGGNLATAQAALSDITTEENRAQGLGLVGAAFGLGFTIGPVITAVSLSVSNDNYSLPAFIAAGFSLASIILTATLFKETLPPAERTDDNTNIVRQAAGVPGRMIASLRLPQIGFLLLLYFLLQAIFRGFTTLFAPLTLTRLGVGAAGNAVVFALAGVVIVVVQGGLIGPLSRRFGERRLIYAGQVALIGGLILLATVPSQPLPGYSQAAILDELGTSGSVELALQPPPDDVPRGYLGILWLVAAVIPLSLGNGLYQPSINSLLTKAVKQRETGRVLGVSSSFFSAANTIGPLISGAIFATAGGTTLFLVNAVVVGGLLLLALRRIRPSAVEASSGAPVEQTAAS